MTRVRIQQNQQWLRLISPNLGGFSFTKGLWGKWRTFRLGLAYPLTGILEFFNIENLEPISWNIGAIDRLVFPEEHKDLLLSFVTNYNQSISHSDDLISGKGKTTSSWSITLYNNCCVGKGLVVLLSGPPGTGKTLTAEAGMYIQTNIFYLTDGE